MKWSFFGTRIPEKTTIFDNFLETYVGISHNAEIGEPNRTFWSIFFVRRNLVSQMKRFLKWSFLISSIAYVTYSAT
jgi:hypothetical protein